MMINKKTISFIVSLLIMLSTIYSRDITPNILGEKGVLIHTIGNNEIVCVINTNYETGAHWFLLKGGYDNREIGVNLSSLAEVSQILPSPDKKYLAVLSVGEGHPMIDVVDLPKLRTKNEYSAVHIIDPYPGTVSIVRWEGSKLIISSDVPLNDRKEDGRVDPNSTLSKTKKFALDILTGKIEKY